ncbi:MAG: hypothetical protein PUB21_11835 [Bacteroidales bacterium]|nr:hypothetical protein [Bacteroidales bacterium]
MKEIIVKHGINKIICDEMGCSHTTVRMALRGVTSTDLAKRIRERAKELMKKR